MTPIVNRTCEDGDDDDELNSHDATQYRAWSARAMFLSQARADIVYTVNGLSRRMRKPKVRDMKDMKRIGMYLTGKERVHVIFERQDKCNVIDVWTDTDYAGCRETRKSTAEVWSL